MNIFKNLLHLSWLLLLVLSLPKFATAQISCDVVASVSDNLSDVIAGAVDSESICLEPGEHTAGFFIRRGDVTITSQAPDNPAVVTGGSYVFNVLSGNNNIVFDNLILDGYSAEALYIRGDGHRIINNEFRGESLDIELNNATNIAILDNLLSGGVGFNTTNVSTSVSRFTHNVEGNIFTDGRVLFYATDEDNPQIPEDAGQVIINNSTNVELSGMFFTNVSVPVQISHSPGAVIDNNDVRNLKNSPLSTLSSGAISVWESEGAIISNNTIDGVDARAIFIDSSPQSVIRENNVLSNLEGVIVRSSDNAQVILNQIDGTTNTGTRRGNGIYISSSESVEILDNDITNNEGYGIFDSRGGASEFALIRGNTITGNNSDGIRWSDVSRVTIDNNRVANNRGTGIVGSRFSTISNNIVTDNTSYGIDNGGDSEVYGNEIRRNNSGVSTTFRTVYYDNIISDNEYTGIYLGNVSDDITIRENTFSGNKVDVRFNSTKEVILRDNTMETGIFLYSSANEYSEYDHIIERNTVAGQPLVYIKGEVNPIIDPNAGQIILFDVSDATIENYSMSNIFVGVHVLHSQNVLIDDITVEGVGDIQDQNTGLIEIMNSVDVTVQNSTFSNARKGFEIGRSEDVSIVNNTINRTEGVNIFRGAFAKLSPRLVFRENTINALRNGYGIDIDQNSHNSIITANQIFESGNDAIRISRSDSSEISSNTLTGGDSNGIYLSRANFISIIENQISEFQMNGIETVSGFSSSDDITLTNNVIVRNIGTGIKLPTENAELVGNRIEENSIGAELNSYFVADSNAVRNNTNEGFLITGGVNDSSLFENIITGNGSGVVNNGSGNLMAPGNWWGDASGPSGGATDPQTEVIANGSGDTVSENVQFDPWLTEDPNDSGEPEDGEATVEFRDQSISSELIYTGGIVQIQAIVDNVGEISGTYIATLSVNDIEVQQAEGFVEYPGSDVIQFFYQINEPGQYSVSIEGLPEQIVYVEPGWTQYQFNSDNSSYAEFLSGPKTEEVRSLWEVEISSWMRSSPVVAEGVVYFGSNNNSIYAVSESSGEIIWEFETKNSVRSSPTLVGNKLIIGNDDGILFGIDKNSGEELWRFSTQGAIRSSPTVANGVAYFGVFDEENGQVYAVDIETGNSLFSFPTGASIFSSPAISEGVLYIGSNDNSFYALDITSVDISTEERLIWSFAGETSFLSTPVVYGNFVYASTGRFGDVELYAFDKKSGEIEWNRTVTGNRTTSPAVANDTLFVGSGEAELFALEFDTGNEIWSTQIEPDFGSISLSTVSPVYADGMLYIGTAGDNGTARMLLGIESVNGTERFRYSGLGNVHTTPAVINGNVYFGHDNGGLVALRETTEEDYIPDAELSSVNVTTPHWADGQDQAQIDVEVYSSSSDPITGLTTEAFEVSAVSAVQVGEVEPRYTDGQYRLYITNHVAETVPVSLTINGVELTQQPEVQFISAESNWSSIEVDFGFGQWNDYADVPAVNFINENTGWLISSFFGDGVAENQTVILHTDDSGETWNEQFFSTDVLLSDITFINESTGWAAASFGVVLRTVDGGDNWQEVTVDNSGDGSVFLNKIHFVDENNGWVGGNSLYKTTDGGDNWTEIPVQESINIQDINFYDQDYGMIAVVNQTEMGAGLFITNDGGETWTSEFNGARLYGIEIVDENRAFVVGNRGLIVTTNDGGTSWEQQYSMVDNDLTAVSFTDNQTGWVIGKNSTILATIDGGSNWEIEYPGTSDRIQLHDIQFVNDLFGWTTGRGGTVLKYGDGASEPPLAVVDADSSTVTATSPHLADGADQSLVVVQLADSLGEPVDRFEPADLLINVSGSADYTAPDNTGNSGEFAFTVSNTIAETVTVSITVDDVLLSDQPEIVFEESVPIADSDSSTVTATSPHFADGVDFSTVTIIVADSLGDPIGRYSPEDIVINFEGGAEIQSVESTGETGTFTATLTSTVTGTITLFVTVDDILLSDQPQIVFEEPIQLVDADSSSVTATSPHLADGEDSSLVVVQLADSLGDPIDRFEPADLLISVSGSADYTAPDNTGNPGEFAFTVSNTIAETVTVTITVDDVLLTDQPEILFEQEVGIPGTPEFVSIDATTSGAELNWSVASSEHVVFFKIYRGLSLETLEPIDEVEAGSRSYTDSNLLTGKSYYAISAVNRDGEEGQRSNIKTFINTDFVASTEWQLVSVPIKDGTGEMELATIYNFSDRYELSGNLESGKGYWVKTKSYSEETMPVTGEGLDSLTIGLNGGWNLIGSLSETAGIRSIQDPDQILAETPLYVYRDKKYIETQEIVPGAGHWIYANDNGSITVTVKNDPPVVSDLELTDQKSSAERIIPALQFSNEVHSSKIFVSSVYVDQLEQSKYYIPPASPEPVLDIRTRDHTKLINNQPTQLLIDSEYYPIKVSLDESDEVNQFAVRIHAENEGRKRTFDLLPGQSDQIKERYDRVSAELIHPDNVVSDNKLMPNYPNPFNPVTTIQYQLREQTHVMIEVYDVIGRRVKMLTNSVQLSGQHSVEFDGRNLASGLYIIRFTAGDVVDIRKMTLVK